MKQNTSQSIAAEIKQRIRAGKIGAGQRVPSAREIVREHGVAIATASRVLAILRKEGLVKPQRGVGTIVKTGERGSELRQEQVVRAAIAIADEEGIAGLSMRQVAVELGVPTVTLTRMFASEEELVLRMADTVLGDVPLPRVARGDWRGSLETVLRAQWRGYAMHPWLGATLSMTRPQLLPNGMQHTELVLEALETLKLGPAITMRTGVMLLAYVRGMAEGLEAERRAEQDTGQSSDEWMASREDLFAPLAKRFPTLGRLSDQPGIDMSLESLFERGMSLLLDGLATPPKARRRSVR